MSLLAVSPALASAQLPPRTAADSARADSLRARRLDPVTVTATRDRRAVRDVPLAVTTLDRADYALKTGIGVNDALSLVPGVLAQSRTGGSDVRLVIRGFGARGAGDRSNAGTARGVRVLLDGFPETEPDGRTAFDNLDLATAEGIDVIRSNASSLWGNAAGGVVNVTTVPSFDRAFVTAQAMSGSFGLVREILQAGTTFGSDRPNAPKGYFTLANTSYEGWRARSDSRRVLLSTGLVAPVGENTLVSAHAVGVNNLFHIPGPLSAAEVAADPQQANATYASRDERRHNRLGRLGVAVEHRIGERHDVSGAVYVNPKYLQRSERGTFRDFTRYHAGGNLVYRYEGRLSSSLSHRFTAGADEAYQDGAILFYSLTPAGTRGTELRDNKGEGANNFGVFVQEELTLNERISLTVGARYDDIRYDYRSHIRPATDAAKSFTQVTPKLGALYRLSPRHSLYANVGGGVEAPAGNETDPAGTFGQDTVTAINPLLDPIRSTTYEMGAKGVVLSSAPGVLHSVGYDLAAYWTTVRNEVVPYRGGRFYFTAGQARRRGVELGGSAQLAGGVSLRAAATYSDNRYVDYQVDSVHYNAPGRLADYSGNRVVGVPDYIYSAQATFAPRSLAGLALQAGIQGTSRYYADDANKVEVPSFALASVGVALDAPRQVGGVQLRGFVNVENLFDRRYIASAFLNPDVVNGAPLAFEPGQPRSLVVSLSLSRGR